MENRSPEKPARKRPTRHGIAIPKPVRWIGGGLAILLALLFVASFFLDEPMRRRMESRMNQSLRGYSVRLPGLHFQLIGMSVTLKDLTVRQNANPEPAVLQIPTLHASVEWRELLTGHLVADFLIDRPRVHINLSQLRQETRDPVPARQKGWQQAIEAIYPLKINLLRIRNADVVYVDDDPGMPLHLANLNATAENIRNIHSRQHQYPSPFHADATIFDTGHASLDGHADFLAEPFPGIHTVYNIREAPVKNFRPVLARSNLLVRGGTLSSTGEIEYAPSTELVDVHELVLHRLILDTVHSPATAANEKEKKAVVKKAASDVNNKPGVLLRVKRMRIVDGDLGMINRAKTPSYRAFLSHANLEITNLSNHFSQGPAHASLSGKFMGSGPSHATATFRPERGGADFDLDAAIEHTDLTTMNDILRAYGKFDVARGDFSFYTEMHVLKGNLSGYMKPLFTDVKVYSPEQDKNKPLGKKIYEKIVGGVAKLLENRKKNDVATRVELTGRLDDPKSSTWQAIGKLLENAFIRAILPGFDRQARQKS